jgi:hypothetical protein
MFTHHPVRNGSVVSISIYGPHGKKFARRIAEEAVGRNERLGALLNTVDVGDRQEFFFDVEPITPQTAVITPARAARNHRLLWSAHRLTPRSI